MARPTKYTAELLAPVVAKSTTLTQVIRLLGLTPNGGNHRMIAARIRRAEIDTSHFAFHSHKEHAASIRVDDLIATVQRSTSLAQVLSTYGMPTVGRAYHEMKKRVDSLAIDTSHFKGQGWSKGLTAATSSSLATIGRKQAFPDEIVFVENGPMLSGPALIKRLVAKGWRYECQICGISEWQSRPLTLHLDHINGINNDNRLVNIRMLCPNCHSQTDTYCNRPKPKPLRASERAGVCYTVRRSERGGIGYTR